MRYNCARATSALTSFHFSECLCFSPQLLIVWNIFFSSFSLDCKQEIWMVGRQVRLRGDHNFSSWEKKKEQEIFRSRRWACIFRPKWCTVGIHNAMARTGLETNSSGDACCLWYRISLSADENMKTNSGNKCISEKWKTYALFVFQSHCCEKELSKSLR